jgi:hypothetical protein
MRFLTAVYVRRSLMRRAVAIPDEIRARLGVVERRS